MDLREKREEKKRERGKKGGKLETPSSWTKRCGRVTVLLRPVRWSGLPNVHER